MTEQLSPTAVRFRAAGHQCADKRRCALFGLLALHNLLWRGSDCLADVAPGRFGGPQPEQPVSAQSGRAAVEFIVGRNFVEERLVAEPAPTLIHDDAVSSGFDLSPSTSLQVEGLQVLDRIARLRRADRFVHHAVEIDELAAAQDVVNLRLPRAVVHR